MKIERVGTILTVGGEGPHWSAKRQALFLVDGAGRHVWRHDAVTGTSTSWATPAFAAGVTTTDRDEILVVLSDRIGVLDETTGEFRPVLQPDLTPGAQFADCKVDRTGGLIVTTSHTAFSEPIGGVFHASSSGLRELDTGYILSNGPCWSPDGRVFYCADSRRRAIYAYDYGDEDRRIAARRTFCDTSSIGGIADGATVDTDGRLWMAFCVVGKVVCFSPDGEVERVIDMPTTGTTSVMFGGRDLNRLFVTSMDVSRFGHPKHPLAGQVFVIDDLAAQGIAEQPARLGPTAPSRAEA